MVGGEHRGHRGHRGRGDGGHRGRGRAVQQHPRHRRQRLPAPRHQGPGQGPVCRLVYIFTRLQAFTQLVRIIAKMTRLFEGVPHLQQGHVPGAAGGVQQDSHTPRLGNLQVRAGKLLTPYYFF